MKNAIYNESGCDMIHAGIEFFGGGKNYSVMDTSKYTNVDYSKYEISLSDAKKYALDAVAGGESFYFYIYDSTTKGFLPEDQKRMLKEGGYSYINAHN